MQRLVKSPSMRQVVVTEDVFEVKEVDGGYIDLLGKLVIVMCDSYIYTGKLTGVDALCIELIEPCIVYETGPWNASKFSNVESLPAPTLLISTSKIESMFESNK